MFAKIHKIEKLSSGTFFSFFMAKRYYGQDVKFDKYYKLSTKPYVESYQSDGIYCSVVGQFDGIQQKEGNYYLL